MHDLIKASHMMIPRCPICDEKYNVQRIQILEESEDLILSYFKCTRCLSSFLASITETPLGPLAAGLITDLEPEEVLYYAKAEPVTHDDVIEVYRQLEGNNLKFR